MVQDPQSHSGDVDELSPEKEFENDVLDAFGYEEPEPIPGDDDAEPVETPQDEPVDGQDEDTSEPVEQYEEPVQQAEPEQNFNLKSDQRGNLIDNSGRIVAKAGSERRLYEKTQKLQKDNQELYQSWQQGQELMVQAKNYIDNIKKELEETKNNSLAGQYNLNPAEQQEAFSVYAKLRDPGTAIDAAKYILTKMAERGIDIKQLGASNAAIDPSVLAQGITGTISQQLQPITEQLKKQQEAEAAKQQEINQVNQFFNQNPDAGKYATQLGQMLRDPRFKGMSLPQAWSKMKDHLHQQELQKLQQQQSQPAEPRPSGRPRPMASTAPRQNVDDSPMHADLTYKDIVQSIRSDYGDLID